MPGAPDHRSSKVAFDGKLMFTVNSPEMSLVTAASDQGKFTAPCAGEIVKATANLVAAPEQSSTLDVGKQGDSDFFTTTPIAFVSTDSTGVRDITSLITEKTVEEGDVIEFNTGGEATTSGSVAVTLVISPNAA